MLERNFFALSSDDYSSWLRQHLDNQVNHLRVNPLSEEVASAIVHFFILLRSGQENLLADTLDSIAAQTFSGWRLTVFAELAAPDECWNAQETLQWIALTDFTAQLNQAISTTPAEWVVLLQPGVVLAEVACAYVLEYCGRFPDWTFIYPDEDRIAASGAYYNPQFKPDFNLDLLRSTPYVGDFCCLRRSVLQQMGGLPHAPGAEVYAAALQFVELCGEQAFGHIPAVLLHVPDAVAQNFNAVASGQALAVHLVRQGIEATIKPGFLPQSFFVDYVLTATPLVAVVINVNGQLEALQSCLHSLAHKTSYTHYEIILLDNTHCVTPNLLEFYPGLNIKLKSTVPSHANAKKSVSTRPPQFAAQEINTALADETNAEYFLFLAVDTLILQPDWLQRLLAQTQRQDCGIVGARLVNAEQQLLHAGIILGLGDLGVADYWHTGVALDESGYMHRTWLTQSFSAVTSACLLVKQRLFQQVGGFSEQYAENLFCEVDFCLKVQQLGYKIVWTPFVTLVYAGSLLPRIGSNTTEVLAIRREADRFIKSWLPQLACDPSFNRHLSLKYNIPKVETLTAVAWDTQSVQKPKIWAFPANDMGVGEYRVRSPLRALQNAGLAQVSFLPNHQERVLPDIVEIERGQADVLLLQNGHLQFLENAWQSYAEFNQVFMIYSQDDLVYNLPGKHPLKEKWPKDLRRRLKQLMSDSDRLIVATEPLAAEYGKMIRDVRIVPNYLETARWTNLALPHERSGSSRPRVGWVGAGQHQGDLEFMWPVLQATHKQVDWIFFGMCPECLKPYVHEFHLGVPFAEYPVKMASLDLDLAVAPLEYNRFNQAKTNLRLLEYGAMGWPVLCTDIQPYKNAPVTRLANGARLWISALLEKVNEPEALAAEGKVLQQWVLENYLLEDHLDEWLKALTP